MIFKRNYEIKVTDNKLPYKMNYSRKRFYSTGPESGEFVPGATTIKPFAAVINSVS